MIKLLVVDDSALVRKLLGQVFSQEFDFEVRFARNGVEALDVVAAFAPDVVTLDVHMPQMDGLACLDRLMVQRPCPVVMVSSLTEQGAEATLEALRLGAVDFVPKPAGAVSLHIDEWAPELVAKVRSAAKARITTAHRLRERVRSRLGATPAGWTRPVRPAKADPIEGEGLVLVGASTGGPPALEQLLTQLPASFPWPILICQHMPASFTGPLSRRLDSICAIGVKEILRPTALEGGCAYIGRGDADMIVARHPTGLVAMPVPSQPNYPWHPSTDRLVHSAIASVSPHRLVGVLMTGMGDDGAQAMVLLKANGGRTIAEAEETAVVWGMPGELVKAGGADWVEPLPNIAVRLRMLVPCP